MEEQAELDKVKEMQERIAARIGGRKDVETTDMKEILMGMGSDWAQALPTLQAAMNSTDQGGGR